MTYWPTYTKSIWNLQNFKDKLLENEYDTLRILLYIGKADVQLRKEEKVIIRKFAGHC